MKTAFFGVLSLLLISIYGAASEPVVWTVNSRVEVLKGNARGVSIDADGSISVAPSFEKIFETGQPYIWSSAADNSSNIYLGTGGEGRVFKVDQNGAGTTFADFPELNVTALVFGRAGELFAATSPDGKVYKIDAAGKSEVYFDPKEKYIWSLALVPDGSLAVATGDSGKIFRVTTPGQSPQTALLFDSRETNIVSLAADRSGSLYAGTDPGGLILKLGTDGKPFALLDSPLREIQELKIAPDGSVYALVLGESISAPPVDATAKAPVIEKRAPAAVDIPPKSRYDLATAKTAVYRVYQDGEADILWSSPLVVGFSISLQNDRVLVGTSDKGRIYSIGADGSEKLLIQSDADQISTLLPTARQTFATSSNSGSLFRLSAAAGSGSYESYVLDAKSTASWGRIWWNAVGDVRMQTRSGNTERPDETWSDWSQITPAAGGGQVPSPKARFLQWRAVLTGSRSQLRETSVAYLTRNIAPEVLSIQVLPANVALLAGPPVQLDPNIAVSGLDPALFGAASVTPAPRRAFQRGARAIQWTAEDRNGDKLIYDVFYKELGDAEFKLLRAGITDNFLTIDGQSLADGRYIVKVRSSDLPENVAGSALAGEKISEPFDIDNSPPTVSLVSNAGGNVVFTASDRSSYIQKAEYSIDGGEWFTVNPDDAIADSPSERFTIVVRPAANTERSLTLRVFDSSGNSGSSRAILGK